MNRKNLKKLADYLATGNTAMQFSMGTYCETSEPASAEYGFQSGYAFDTDLDPCDHKCGTIGCALGHGPAAGIAPRTKSTDWADYGEKHFLNVNEEREWDWCFSSAWEDVDNTPQGAAKRIYHMLEYGVPEQFRPSSKMFMFESDRANYSKDLYE